MIQRLRNHTSPEFIMSRREQVLFTPELCYDGESTNAILTAIYMDSDVSRCPQSLFSPPPKKLADYVPESETY